LVYPAYLTEPRDSNEVDPVVKNLRRGVTPPMFMTVARDDPFARGMLNFFINVHQAKLAAECHVYAAGGHGGGIDPIAYPSSEWTGACVRWLADLEQAQPQ
jgi:acetyl esterase/lipase